MGDFKVVEISWENQKICFSVEPLDETQKIDNEEINDIVEEAIYDAKEDPDVSLKSVGDSIFYALSNEGYLVRDIPEKYETLSYDVENYQLEDYDR